MGVMWWLYLPTQYMYLVSVGFVCGMVCQYNEPHGFRQLVSESKWNKDIQASHPNTLRTAICTMLTSCTILNWHLRVLQVQGWITWMYTSKRLEELYGWSDREKVKVENGMSSIHSYRYCPMTCVNAFHKLGLCFSCRKIMPGWCVLINKSTIRSKMHYVHRRWQCLIAELSCCSYRKLPTSWHFTMLWSWCLSRTFQCRYHVQEYNTINYNSFYLYDSFSFVKT